MSVLRLSLSRGQPSPSLVVGGDATLLARVRRRPALGLVAALVAAAGLALSLPTPALAASQHNGTTIDETDLDTGNFGNWYDAPYENVCYDVNTGSDQLAIPAWFTASLTKAIGMANAASSTTNTYPYDARTPRFAPASSSCPVNLHIVVDRTDLIDATGNPSAWAFTTQTGGRRVLIQPDYRDLKAAGKPYGSAPAYCNRDEAAAKTGVAGCYDLPTVILHEFGHVFALGHYDYGGRMQYSVMYSKSLSTNSASYQEAARFGTCDLATFQLRYGLPNYTTLYSPCHATIPLSLQLQASATTVSYGGTITFTATFKISSGAFANRPLSNRTIALQWAIDGVTYTHYAYLKETSTAGEYRYTTPPLYMNGRFKAVWVENATLPEPFNPKESTYSPVTVLPPY